MSIKTVVVYKWNPEAKKFDVPVEIELVRPGQYGKGSGPSVPSATGKPAQSWTGRPGATTVKLASKEGGGYFENKQAQH